MRGADHFSLLSPGNDVKKHICSRFFYRRITVEEVVRYTFGNREAAKQVADVNYRFSLVYPTFFFSSSSV